MSLNFKWWLFNFCCCLLMEQLERNDFAQNLLCRSRLIEVITGHLNAVGKKTGKSSVWHWYYYLAASVVSVSIKSKYSATHIHTLLQKISCRNRHLKAREHIDIPHLYDSWQLHSNTLSEELDTRHYNGDAVTKLLWSREVPISMTSNRHIHKHTPVQTALVHRCPDLCTVPNAYKHTHAD